MSEEQLHDRIEKYLLDELSPEEKTLMESDIAKDPAFKEQVEIQRLALLGIKEYMASDMREKFRQWDLELDAAPSALLQKGKPSIKFKILAWSVGLLAFLLTILTVLYVQQLKVVRKMDELKKQEVARRDSLITDLESEIQKKQAELNSLMSASSDSLFQREIQILREDIVRLEHKVRDLQRQEPVRNQQIAMALAPPPASLYSQTRSLEEELNPLLKKAMLAYDSARFEEAVYLLNNIPKTDAPLRRGALDILPFALFYNLQFEEALITFEELKREDKYKIETSEGYQALCYIALGRFDQAREVLPHILNDPNHPFYSLAPKLKATLEMGSN